MHLVKPAEVRRAMVPENRQRVPPLVVTHIHLPDRPPWVRNQAAVLNRPAAAPKREPVWPVAPPAGMIPPPGAATAKPGDQPPLPANPGRTGQLASNAQPQPGQGRSPNQEAVVPPAAGTPTKDTNRAPLGGKVKQPPARNQKAPAATPQPSGGKPQPVTGKKAGRGKPTHPEGVNASQKAAPALAAAAPSETTHSGPESKKQKRPPAHKAPAARAEPAGGKPQPHTGNQGTGGKAGQKAKPKTAAREGTTKKETVLALLRRPQGATLAELQKATGWQSHSVRGFLSGALRKNMGLKVKSGKRENGERVYSTRG
jgi:hypothetical protein